MATWCTIESDPGVFTEIINGFGVKGVEIKEAIGFEKESLMDLKPIYGLIFLFEWKAQAYKEDTRPIDHSVNDKVFFARQMITNACATQAIVSLLLNLDKHINLGPELSNFKEFVEFLDPETRGEAIGNSDVIRNSHNSFARPEPFVFEEKSSEGGGSAEKLYHYIGFVPVNGVLYELDGLRAGPIPICKLNGKNPFTDDKDVDEWLTPAINAIQQRVAKYPNDLYNLMTLSKSKKDAYATELDNLLKNGMSIENENEDNNNDPIKVRIRELKELIAEEEIKLNRRKVENQRRKHNYVPFIFNILKKLAERGKLSGLIESATKSHAEREAKLNVKPTTKPSSTTKPNTTPNATSAPTTTNISNPTPTPAPAPGSGSAPSATDPTPSATPSNSDKQPPPQ